MYTSGALSSPPSSAIASTASALGPALAVMVVPSSGSSAISMRGPVPMALPTFSPMNSIGASSRSPSPITTVPSKSSMLSAPRIASTAAASAAFSSPRPIILDAPMAAYSVTRTISRTSTRSSAVEGCTGLEAVICFFPTVESNVLRFTPRRGRAEGVKNRARRGSVRNQGCASSPADRSPLARPPCEPDCPAHRLRGLRA